MIDEINQRAVKEGKKGSLIRNRVVESEIQDRIQQYRTQAKQWIRSGQWGAARLAVEKILLLMPEDKEGLGLQGQIRQHNKSQSE